MCWERKLSLLKVNVIENCSIITGNVFIDSISVDPSSTLDVSLRLQETVFT